MAAYDIDKIYAVKKKVQGRLLAIPGVHGVGLGAKYVGGQRTLEPAIMVFVTRKKPAAELLPHEIISTEIDGVKTDVMESTPPRLMADVDARFRPLVGGGQIQGGGSLPAGGTLGCIARTNGPTPIIVGLTNHHCVGIPAGVEETRLIVTVLNNTITFAGANTAGTLIVVEWNDSDELWSLAFYQTTKDDSLEDIAERIAQAITSNTLPSDEIEASRTGRRVTIISTRGNQVFCNAKGYGPPQPSDKTHLQANVERNQITLTGKASKNYGIFTNWNFGGLVPTKGVYTPVRKGSELAEVATDIAASINGLLLEGITAAASGSTVTITGPQQVECNVSSDVRIGQPSSCFCSACCACCNDFIGVVRDARIEVDVALIELAGGLKYRAEINQIGPVRGTHTYTLIDLLQPRPILVRKRGAKTGLTHGVVTTIDHVGQMGGGGLFDRDQFHRYFANVIKILPDKNFNEKFSDHGDSGSAVVNEKDEVIGILFGTGLTTPIAEIEAAFDLSVVAVAAGAADIQTVPATQGHAFAALEPEPLFVDRLRDIEREFIATPVGRELAEVGRRHAHEVVQLVNHNRRVGAVWRRNGGPEIIQTAFTLAQTGEKQLPRQINGRPLAECLRKMQAILTRYGSAELIADLRRYGPRIIDLTNLDYPQLIAALGTAR